MNFLNGYDTNPDDNVRKDVHEMLDELRAVNVRMFTFPFDQTLKRKMVVYALSHEEARVVVKGSPESIAEITNTDITDITVEMAQMDKGLKLLSYATKVIRMEEIRDIQQQMEKGIDMDESGALRQ